MATVPNEPTPPSTVTLSDVARLAGVAVSTVSRALTRPGRVNAATAQRIFEAAETLGYRHSALPAPKRERALNRIVAITVADMANPVYASYVAEAQKLSLSRGFGLHVIDFRESAATERTMIGLSLKHVDGFILASSRMPEHGIRKLASMTPVVAMNRPVKGVRSILADPRRGLDDMLARLRALGHDSLTYLAGPVTSWQDGSRWSLLMELCPRHGIRLSRLTSPNPTFQGGYRCLDAFLARPTSAVLGFNDNIAIGFSAALRDAGVRVPEQVSVVGIDDIPVDLLLTPRLSTIRLDRRTAGRRAMELMLDMLEPRVEDAAAPTAEGMSASNASNASSASSASAGAAGPSDGADADVEPEIVSDSTFVERDTTGPARGHVTRVAPAAAPAASRIGPPDARSLYQSL